MTTARHFLGMPGIIEAVRRKDFQYRLPKGLIAQEPLPRGTSRMMVVEPRNGPPKITHATFGSFPDLIGTNDLVVINDTRVLPARLFATPKGRMQRPIEILLTRRIAPLRWEAWCKPARRVRSRDALSFSDLLGATVNEKRSDGTLVLEFSVFGRAAGSNENEFWKELERIGIMPLPPYIERKQPREQDRLDYQTVYAVARAGAIAAPTAGLHFTPEILRKIEDRLARITLDVGIGTFKPVKADRIEEHSMDSEKYEISSDAAAALNDALARDRPIVAVGTTTVRALESAVMAGGGRFEAGADQTSIFITPGFRFRVVDKLLTNFHLPESTLLMLVSAFAGMETIRKAYREAIAERYRFYSYGDCMLLRGRGSW